MRPWAAKQATRRPRTVVQSGSFACWCPLCLGVAALPTVGLLAWSEICLVVADTVRRDETVM